MAKLVASSKAAPVGALITAEAAKGQGLAITVSWGEETSYSLPGGAIGATSCPGIARCIARQMESSGLYGGNILQKTEVDHWLTFCLGPLSCGAELKAGLVYLDSVLLPTTFLVGNAVSIADYCVFGSLFLSPHWLWQLETKMAAPNLLRWYTMMAARSEVSAVVASLPAAARVKAAPPQDPVKEKKEESAGGKFVDLPGAEIGKVVVRFPPEASGYLHVGHAKAALLNYHYKEIFQGRLIMRFDDTNPAKEKEEYEEVILDDMKLLKVKYDHFSRTSDHFETILGYCEKLLKEGKAYVDDTDADTMKAEREAKKESKNRNNPVAKNLQLWEEMKKGSAVGTTCAVRAKIDMQSANGCLRDPTIYRCKPEPHPATGTKYKVYPTYDFACPVVDSVEGVTHALRTTEYMDRDDQFMWFIDALGLRKPNIYAYARLNLTNTVMSKRKLTWLVDTGAVEGWDDPRMPTVRGVLRRGLTVEALQQFIIAQGSSRSVVFMEWDKIWAFNKKVIDPVVPRHTTVDKAYRVPVSVAGAVARAQPAARHPKNPDVGEKIVHIGPVVLIDGVDAEELKVGENATFINWGNLMIKAVKRGSDGKVESVDAVENLDNKDFKKTLKLTWLCADELRSPFTPVVQVYYDHIISKAILDKDDDFKQFVGKDTKTEVEMLGDPELQHLKKGDIVQVQRRGFFICDSEYEPYNQSVGRARPLVLISIPDGTPGSYGPPGKKPEPVVPAAKTGKAKSDAKKPAAKAADSQAKQAKAVDAGGAADASILSTQIQAQGEKVRAMKEAKADKAAVGAEVKVLLELKANFKTVAGKEWQPEAAQAAPAKPAAPAAGSAVDSAALSAKITAQGDLVRKLKADKASKADIDAAVKALLAYKQEFKAATGQEWKAEQPAVAQAAAAAPAPGKKAKSPPVSDSAGAGGDLNARIAEQGNKVRQLKADKKEKAEIDEAVRLLLEMKASFKEATGKEWMPAGAPGKEKREEKKKEVKPKEKPVAPTAGVTRLGMEAKKEDNLPDWYSQVLTKAEMMEYYDVSGCYILRPWSFAIWESIKDFFDAEIKKLGVENCYFPCFVSHAALEREKTHIADFAPEVAWVTRSGNTDLAEPIAIRPTSETVMYPAYAKWIQSYRDLPLKLNQWNNVVRWEFKHPQPFLRTREFLWQEGHTAFATFDEAKEEVLQILDLYRRVYEELLAIPVIRGRKTEKEKFAGGDYTTTVEAYIAAAGRAIQGATSHHLGQNFSKMFDITFENPETGEKQHVFQNSWGITTRTIGVLVMIHGDNNGLVLPPRVACLQVVIVPCGVTVNLKKEERDALYRECDEYRTRLLAVGVRAKADMRENYSPGWKFNHWELKGVPIRVEIGPRDMKENQYVAVRRDSGEKIVMRKCGMEDDIPALLTTIQSALFARARTEMADHVKVATTFPDFLHHLDNKCLIQAPFCGNEACEDEIKELSKKDADQDAGAPSMGAKSLCIPFNQPAQLTDADRCVRPACDRKPQYYTLFGRSY